MRVCCKCNTEISITHILKSTYKRNGIIECNKCHSKFKIKYYLLIVMSLIALICTIMSYVTTYYPTTIVNSIIRGILAVVIELMIYTGLAFSVPWEEEQ